MVAALTTRLDISGADAVPTMHLVTTGVVVAEELTTRPIAPRAIAALTIPPDGAVVVDAFVVGMTCLAGCKSPVGSQGQPRQAIKTCQGCYR